MPILQEYTAKLSDNIKNSFPTPKMLVELAMQNYDPHFLYITSKNASLPMEQRIKGLLVFSLDTNLKKDPKIDEEKCQVSFIRTSKVNLHHISSIDEN